LRDSDTTAGNERPPRSGRESPRTERDASAATLTLPSHPQGKDILGLTIHREDGLYLLVDLEREEAHVFSACLERYLSEVFAVAPGALLP